MAEEIFFKKQNKNKKSKIVQNVNWNFKSKKVVIVSHAPNKDTIFNPKI